jgi:hypothetical protein
MIIHVHPDLDAITCVALASVDVDYVHMLPAGIEKLPDVCPCHGRPLDPRERMIEDPLGDKGRLDPDGTRHAAACAMPEARFADPDLLAEVDEQDSTGKVDQPRFSLAAVMAGLREEGRGRGLRGQELDYYVLDLGSRVIRGLLALHRARQAADAAIDDVPIVEVGTYRFAILIDNGSPSLGIALARRGVCGAIYAEGANLGVTRYPGYAEPDLRKLASQLPGWFIHSAGFLACWGSRKNPAQTPPPAGTPQTVHDLLQLLHQIF